MSSCLNPALTAYRQHRHLLSDAASTLAVNLLGTLLVFLTQVLLARILGVDEFSLYTYSFTILTVAATLSLFGFDIAVLRFVPAALADGNWAVLRGFMRRAAQITLLVSIISGFLLSGVAYLSSVRLNSGLSEALIAASLTIPISALLLLYSAFARGLQRPLLAVSVRLVLKPLAFMALAALFAVGWIAPSAAWAFAVELVANLLAVALLARLIGSSLHPVLHGVEPSFETRMWLSVSFPLFLTTCFQLLMRQTDILLLGSIEGAATVGPYAAASRISQLASFGLLSINAVLPALVSKHIAKGEMETTRRIISLATLGTFFFSAVASAVIWLFAAQLLAWFGPDFIAAVPILHILIIGQMLNAMTGSVSYILGVTGHQKILAAVVLSTMVLNVLLCVMLIPPFGPEGAAVAVAISTSFSNIALVIVCLRRASIDPSILGAIKLMLAR